MEINERKTAITGVGQSEVGRPVKGKTALALTVEASLSAIKDAGLRPEDIDGIATWPGEVAHAPGISPVGVTRLKEALGLKLNWFAGGGEAPGQFGSIFNACAAVALGLANHVVCFRTLYEASTQTAGRRASVIGTGSPRIAGRYQWQVPFRAMSGTNWMSMFAQRHFHEYGTTREQMAQIALNARKNAALNPKAIYRKPLTMEDYLSARMISSPLCLNDCDVPIDGSTAIIISRADVAKDMRKPPLRIEAIGSAAHGRDSWDQFDDLTTMAARDVGKMLWSRTDLRPSDVDVAGIYDGFSFLTMAWLEALQFCGKGESGPFIEGGSRIARDGELPLNTDGGQLSAGRLHGYGLLHEVCRQLWGECGERQVKGSPEVGISAAGGGPLAGAMLITRL
ncbi:MAG: thiolase family protein [Kordiimonadaceae bacterium]|nr:thiolase family protein [Kordiimonadaceae bacterium]